MSESEIGRELKAYELKPEMVVLIQPPNNKLYVTLWVSAVDHVAGIVAFFAGELRWTVINFIQPDGSITDDRGHTVHVYEYLGKI